MECHAISRVRRCARFALDRQFRPEIENDLIVGNLGGSDNDAVGGKTLKG